MTSVRLCLPEQTHGLRPDAVKGEELIEIGGQIREGVVPGIEERAGRGSADLDTVEDGAAVCGIGHAPRIGNGVEQAAQRRAEIIAVRTDIASS
jgi:hypothetical protein